MPIPEIWTKLNPKLVFDTKFYRYRIRYFFIPIFLNTKSDTFFDTESETTKKIKKFRDRKVSKPKHHPKYPKFERNWIRNLFPIPNFTEYRIRNHQKKGIVLKPRSFETETSHSSHSGEYWTAVAVIICEVSQVEQGTRGLPKSNLTVCFGPWPNMLYRPCSSLWYD